MFQISPPKLSTFVLILEDQAKMRLLQSLFDQAKMHLLQSLFDP